MTRDGFAWYRVTALARKDAGELMRNPGAIVPAVLMVFAALFPVLLIIAILPRVLGETLDESGEFAEEAAAAVTMIPEMTGLTGNALIQTFLFHQLALLMLLVPIVAAMALATHAVIGEKQSKALEPLLATPISTVELLAAKTLTPFLFSAALTWSAAMVYVLLAAAIGEPGVWQAVAGPRLFIMFGLLGPLVALASLLISVIVSSRAADPRSAQQISGVVMGAIFIGPGAMLLASLGCALLNVILLWVGVRVFQRESILTRWR
jgi:ABC-2 type transport system permease protein